MDVLLSEAQIQQRVRQLGRQIEADYQGKPLTIVAVLTGSLILLADLIRQIQIPLRVALLQASSYKGCNVTVPFKFDAFAAATTVTPRAQAAG